jgi:hypothetical protein
VLLLFNIPGFVKLIKNEIEINNIDLLPGAYCEKEQQQVAMQNVQRKTIIEAGILYYVVSQFISYIHFNLI